MFRTKSYLTRQHLRFPPHGPHVCTMQVIDGDGELEADYAPSNVGLVVNESLRGAGVVFAHMKGVSAGTLVRCQAGPMPVMRAEVRWVRELERGVTMIGIVYLEG